MFFDNKGVIHHEYVPEGQTISATFYKVVDCLCKRIVGVRPEMWADRKFFLLLDNARPQTAAIVEQFFDKKGVAQLSHPSHSPDLSTPPNYFTFAKLKLELKGDHYASIPDIQKSVTAKLKAFPISDFVRTMKRLEDHANEYIRVSTISNKYYLCEFFAFFFTIFAVLSQNLPDTRCIFL